MYGKEMIITPELANKMLKNNTNNIRNVSRNRVDAYAKDMKAGLWQANGEAIVFSKNGTLLNGQHRLYAVIKADAPVKMFVIFDAEDNVSIYDSGYTRTVTNIIGGGMRSTGVSAARLVMDVLTGARSRRCTKTPTGELIDFINLYKNELNNAVSVCGSGANHGVCNISACCAAAFILLLGGEDEQELRGFFTVANSIIPDSYRESTPALVLRKMIESDKTRGIPKVSMLACTIQAFEDYKNYKRRTKQYLPDLKTLNSVFYTIRKTSGDRFIKNANDAKTA